MSKIIEALHTYQDLNQVPGFLCQILSLAIAEICGLNYQLGPFTQSPYFSHSSSFFSSTSASNLFFAS